MLNRSFIGIEGLGRFRDKLLIDSVNNVNSYTVVPSGTIAKSYVTYYTYNSTTQKYSEADPQPEDGSTIAANTYWVIDAGSPVDPTRAPSVAAMTGYVEDEISTLESSVNTSLGGKLSSVALDANTDTIYSNTGSGANTVATFAGGTGISVSSSGTTVTISATGTSNTTGTDDISSKIFLVGALAQSAASSDGIARTYTQDTAYVGSDGYLYSGSKKVATEEYVTAAIGAAIAASY